jgi:hypothetical protein
MTVKRKIKLLVGALLGSGALFAFTYITSVGVDSNGVFQLDGNATTDVTVPGEDWQSIVPPTIAGTYSGPAIATSFASAAGKDAAFTGGGSKDISNTSSWAWKNASSPGKDTLTNAYAAAYNVNNHLVIYFGADRFDNSGSAQLGFWFFVKKESLTGTTSGGFSPAHSVGDVLVLANFTVGGAVSNVQVLEWVGTGGDQKGGTLQGLTSVTSGCAIGSGDILDACAIANSSPTQLYWSYSPKGGGPTNVAPVNDFFEGGIDLTQLFLNLHQTAPCIASFMAETRSSTSVDSTLQDFVGPSSFNVCGISISKSCPTSVVNAAGTGFTYSYNGFVKNSPFGAVDGVVVTDKYQTGTDASGNPILSAPVTYTIGSIAAGGTKYFPSPDDPTAFDTFNSTVNGAINTASATSTTTGVNTVSTSATCPALTLSPTLTVTKNCAVCFEQLATNGPVVADVTFSGTVCNTSNTQLTSLQVTDVPASTAAITLSATTLYPQGHKTAGGVADDCANYSGSYVPSALPIVLPANLFPTQPLGFSDTAKATASSTLGGNDAACPDGTPSGTACGSSGPVYCPICPAGNCSP